MDETKTIARHIAELEFSSIPGHVIEEMKSLLLDYLGVALGGSRTESGRIVAQFAGELGGHEEATIIGFAHRVSAPEAAFSNAILSHSIELDDVDSLAYFHYSPPIFSAALALGESTHCSGRELVTALVAGCDLMARLSAAMNPSLRDRGFHSTSTCGVFAAAAACARLLKLGQRETLSALGLAGAQASGLMEFYGTSMQKRFNPGPAARGGVVSALLTERGFTGAETILEGDRGFLRAYCDGFDIGRLVEAIGSEFPILVEYKPYACARPIHTAIDCALSLRDEHGLDPSQIERISVFRHPRWANYHQIWRPKTYHEAQVSLPFAVAVSLVEGEAFLEQFSEDRLKCALIGEIAGLVDIHSAEDLPTDISCRMEIVLKDGSQYTSQVDHPRGSRQNPMTADERRRKFKRLSSPLLDEERQGRVETMVYQIERVGDISDLLGLVTFQGAGSHHG